jgi:hypothetical protein
VPTLIAVAARTVSRFPEAKAVAVVLGSSELVQARCGHPPDTCSFGHLSSSLSRCRAVENAQYTTCVLIPSRDLW